MKIGEVSSGKWLESSGLQGLFMGSSTQAERHQQIRNIDAETSVVVRFPGQRL